ncbi:LysM peptidoglycan-binding domain-containing protein [Flavobacterium aciduliphilum]|uniref:Membrane-bound lytic murein transglycosylase D n=1 Tax=Flavobacterium aciduliphilum TaxID=1101402 RepID=A0A328YHU6_9FLAO|nr:LysM peptidoglycan-binding domain-containing protein [Flavobacterium aciduliphilum]RAR72864.1 membrane-bound lytic murein transglycosylase D [Flavobacterium aciduliphilum]
MIKKNKITTFLLFSSFVFFAQTNDKQQDTIVKPIQKISYLDSIKSTFVHDEIASCIDSLWMKEMTLLDVYNEMLLDIKNVDVDQEVDYELPTELLKERLKKLDEKSPFNIEYNVGLENVIKSFLKNRKKTFERLLGVSQYYFPMFEEELAKNNIPLEIKYLAVVESALNPRAVSRVGATGLWQFMYQTGKQYGLDIDSYVDDRSEPLKASQAASQYMNNMYKIFGDWDLVLAAYNSGPGNVAKAIRRSGGQQNYWNIRKNLPKETQGYLPAFLATMYIFEYHKEHGIVPEKPVANLFATDTIMIKKHITFRQISDLLDMPVAELQFFNPSFKRNEIPVISGKQAFLRLPKDKIAVFTSNEDKIYAYVDYEESKREKPFERLVVKRVKDSLPNDVVHLGAKTKYYKVKRGDNLMEIAQRYDVTLANLKSWNHLKSNRAPRGKMLRIVLEKEAIVQNTNTKWNDTLASTTKEKPTTDAKTFRIDKQVSYKDVVKTYKVSKGDNLGAIASKYGVTVADIKKWNKLQNDNLGLGDNLKIIKNEKVVTLVKKELKVTNNDKNEALTTIENKNSKSDKLKKTEYQDTIDTENYYVVAKGDNLFSIAKKNNVSVENIKEWNNLIDTNVKVGTQLIISSQPLTESKNQDTKELVESKNIEHIVEKGEFLGTIARKYNVSIDNLLEWNALSDTAIKVGTKLIVGKEQPTVQINKINKKDSYAANGKKEKANMYQVRKGDTLLKISQKFPGVTIADIKKWNHIKGENIKPGMKLKING